MYEWRKMTKEERKQVLRDRMDAGKNWHSPTHFKKGEWFHVTAACYEHRPLIGKSEARLERFTRDLLRVFRMPFAESRAWCVLPNHYHVLARLFVQARVRQELGRLHGRNSHQWNVEEDRTGRKCFHRCLCKEIKSEAHWWSTLNYIHHNPVKHKLVDTWRDWKFSSARRYLAETPRQTVCAVWKEYPIKGMGENWDEAY
jgi:putative transposase